MNPDEIIRALRENADWCDANEYEIPLCMGDNQWEAADLIESLQAQLSEKDAEIKRLNDEPPAYKFYYCESENSYLLGRRMDTMYYAHWYDGCGFVWDMSRYLPWGEHVVAPHTAWKEHTYPSEPKEIGSSEWFKGFLAQRLSASQRREKAAVEDLSIYKDCGFCAHLQDQQYCYKNCQRHVDVDNFRTHPRWQWRGPQEAER